MKIEVRRRISNGLVICLQASVIVPKVADTAAQTMDALDLHPFVANQVRSIPDGATARVEIEVGNEFAADGSPSGVDPSGGDPSGGDPSGGDPSGGDPSGGDPSGGDPSGGDPSGGDPSGGDPSGGDPSGGDPSGGDPSGGDPSGGDPSGGDPSGGDPSGGDPSGGDPSGGCDPSAGEPELRVIAPNPIQTDESGEYDFIEVSLSALPQSQQTYTFVSSNPKEATVSPATFTFLENACQPRLVTVTGQSDGVVDGDVAYTVDILDPAGQHILSLTGINIDDDQLPEVSIDVQGPRSLLPGESGIYTVRLSNTASANTVDIAAQTLVGYDLVIESTPGLTMSGYVCNYLSGAPCNATPSLADNQLVLSGLDLNPGETLLLSVDTQMAGIAPQSAVLSARFVDPTSGNQSSDVESTPIAIFRSSFEND